MAGGKFQRRLNALKSSSPTTNLIPEVAASVAARDTPAPFGTPEASRIRSEIARPGLEPEGQIIRVSADEIYEVEQVRPEDDFDEDIIAGMVDSFSEFGNLTPPRCFPKDRNGYRVWFGATRIRSMKKRGDEFIDIYVGRPPKDEKQRIMGQLIENLQQSGLKPLATAIAFEKLKTDFNMTGEEIAKSLGKPTAFVSKHMRIGSAPEKIKALLKNKSVSDVDLAYTLIQINSLDAGAADRLIEKHTTGKVLTRALVKKELDKLKGRANRTPEQQISHEKFVVTESQHSENEKTSDVPSQKITHDSGKAVFPRDSDKLVPVVMLDGAECTVMLDKRPEKFGWVWVKISGDERYVNACDVQFLGLRSV